MNSKGTIVYIGGFELPDRNAAAHRVLNNAKIFRDLGYKVVFIGVDKTQYKQSQDFKTKNVIQGFDSWSLPYPSNVKGWFKYLFDIKDYKSIVSVYDDICLVVAYNYQAIALYKIMKLCRKNKCKIIADCTEWYNTKGSKLAFKVIKGFDSFMRMRVVQKKLDGIIVISRYLEKYYNYSIPVMRVPPLVDINEDKWLDGSIEQKQQSVKFVFSGTLGSNKERIDLIIRAFSRMHSKAFYKLEIIGISKEEYTNRYPSDIGILNELGNKIVFHGRQTHLQSLQILKSADFSIFIRENNFSNKAGFPTKFVESMTSGIPVITTISSDLNEYIISGKNGFFINITNEENTFSILNKVISMNRDEIEVMKDNCRILNGFHYKLFGENFKEFLDRVDIISKD